MTSSSPPPPYVRFSRKLPDDLSVAEYAEIMSAISGVCEGGGWLMPTRQLAAASDMRIIGARYGSPLTVVVVVGAASWAVYQIARAVKEVAAVGEMISRTELNRVEADVRIREVEALERKTARGEELLDAQIALTKQQTEREAQETVKARLDADAKAMENVALRDALTERRKLARQGVYKPAIYASLRAGDDPHIRERLNDHMHRPPQSEHDLGTTERFVDDMETVIVYDLNIEFIDSPEWPPADDEA
ncbi:hypothetical protein SAMN05880545_1056 [Microbacterium sp. RU33B]|nr:hypothetical protein SAMN05880545_1056 [Microbacterium sp. RU33B]